MFAIFVVLIALFIIGWLGFRVRAKPFIVPTQQSRDLGKVRAPQNLPQPVCRYMQTLFGDEIPVVDTAVISGWVQLRIAGIPLKGRFQIYHNAGRDYYHHIQITWFGIPVMSVHERFMNGEAVMALPGNHIENDAHTNAAALQGLWAESVWLPMILFTDPRVGWEAIDTNTARLIIPGAAHEEHLTVGFDPENGMLATIDTMRYQQAGNSERLRWHTRSLKWESMNAILIPVLSELRWENDQPWAVWHVEDVRYNVDVSERFAHFG